jgi:Ca2+/Na+ antiporter
MLLLSVYTFRGQRINRADGALFLALYIGYIAYLLLR